VEASQDGSLAMALGSSKETPAPPCPECTEAMAWRDPPEGK